MYKCILRIQMYQLSTTQEEIYDISMSRDPEIFGEHLIVRDGSFHIEDHEKAALVGPNGAGKSTLLKMIVGELAPG